MDVIKIISFFLVSRSLSSQSFAINKCTDSQGKISFQDKPCPDTSELSIIQSKSSAKSNGDQSVNNPDIKIVDVILTNSESFSIVVPSDWQDSVQLDGAVAPTLNVSVLTNNIKSDNYAMALLALHMITI